MITCRYNVNEFEKLKVYPFFDLLFGAEHVLIGGTTGCGKTTLIDDYLYSLMGRYKPNEVRLTLIDPKRVSFGKYRNSPFVDNIITENRDIINMLKYAVSIMESRYKEMKERDLEIWDGSYIVIVIDELADLMTTCKKEVVPLIQRIAQLGRAAKIKLVCATQAPNRKVIDANLVVNFNGRLALRCLSPIESRQLILDKGAEKLPLHGKALYLHNNGRRYEINVPLTSRTELENRINFWKKED